jgi:hypothetical protein
LKDLLSKNLSKILPKKDFSILDLRAVAKGLLTGMEPAFLPFTVSAPL